MIRQIFLLLMLTNSLVLCAQKSTYNVLVGTYTSGSSEGIYSLQLDEKGNLLKSKLLIKSDNPSFLAFSKDKKYVYAVNESGDKSAVSAFKFNKTNESLIFINKIELGNAGPCHVSVTKKHVITANYGNGTISILNRNTDGSLTAVIQTIVHKPKTTGVNQSEQTHVHQTVFSPNGKWLIVNNLGTNCVYSYRYLPYDRNQPLQLMEENKIKNQGGPRHAVFTKNGKFLYLLNELNATLIAFEVKPEGRLNNIQEVSLVENPNLKNGAADIHLSVDEKYLYATNRGEANTISCLQVQKNGMLAKKSIISTNGNGPRNFAMSPDGNFLLIGNQKSDNITIFQRDNSSGELQSTGKEIKLGAPVCLLFY